jgi:hypothetical protein
LQVCAEVSGTFQLDNPVQPCNKVDEEYRGYDGILGLHFMTDMPHTPEVFVVFLFSIRLGVLSFASAQVASRRAIRCDLPKKQRTG